MSLESTVKILESIFDMPRMRREKCETLYGLGRRIGGVIVELGTFHGCGAISLAMGAREWLGAGEAHVFTIDDYTEKRGWATEPYGPEDMDVCRDNLARAGVDVTMIVDEANQAADEWLGPINLIFWDLGINGRLVDDFAAWGRHIVTGGTFAIHDTMNRTLGSDRLARDAVESGKWLDMGFLPGGVQLLVKRRK